jgi:trimeric autotransporter adhesin
MSSKKSQLRLVGAFAALATLALAISCRGFFVNPTLTSLAIGPQNLSLTPGESFQLVATGTFNDGSTATVTGKCSWSSSDQSVATFSSSVIGQITAAPLNQIPNPPGTTSVQASDGTVTSSSFTVTVCPVVQTLVVTVNGGTSATITSGQTATFDAEATFNGVTGNQNVTNQVTWNISNTAVLPSITNGSGTTVTGVDNTTSVSATLCSFTSQSVKLTTIN